MKRPLIMTDKTLLQMVSQLPTDEKLSFQLGNMHFKDTTVQKFVHKSMKKSEDEVTMPPCKYKVRVDKLIIMPHPHANTTIINIHDCCIGSITTELSESDL